MNIKVIIYFLLIAFSFSQVDPDACPLFRCSKVSLVDGDCVAVSIQNLTDKTDPNKFYNTYVADIVNCNSTSYCRFDYSSLTEGVSQCVKKGSTRKVDQENCVSDGECWTNACIDSKCYGYSPNSTFCSNSGQCRVGYYCGYDGILRRKCFLQAKINDTCSSDEGCVNNAICVDKKCIKMFSLKDGSVSSRNDACESNLSLDGKCTRLILLDSAKCSTTKKYCELKNNVTGTVVQSPCTCRVDGTKDRYCATLSHSDSLFTSVNEELVKYYNGEALNKHTVYRDQYPYDLKSKVIEKTVYPTLNGADKCVNDLSVSMVSTSSTSRIKSFTMIFAIILLFI